MTKVDCKWQDFAIIGKNSSMLRRKCYLPAFSSFSTMFSNALLCGVAKNPLFVVTGLDSVITILSQEHSLFFSQEFVYLKVIQLLIGYTTWFREPEVV